MRLREKVAIVTGATKGIGRACAEEFAREGARVVLAGRTVSLGEEAAEKIRAEGGDAIFIPCDVSRRDDVERVLAETIAHYGRIDILLNNAGVNHRAEFLDVDEETFDQILTVNLKGYFLMGQAVARQMVEQGDGGVIINMSSIMAELALSDQAPYCASKGAIRQLTKAMALSLAPYNIRVNAIGPGPVLTELMQVVAHNKEAWHTVLSRTPIGRVADTHEIGRVAVFLASEDAAYVFGQTVYVDGGRLIQGLHKHENIGE